MHLSTHSLKSRFIAKSHHWFQQKQLKSKWMYKIVQIWWRITSQHTNLQASYKEFLQSSYSFLSLCTTKFVTLHWPLQNGDASIATCIVIVTSQAPHSATEIAQRDPIWQSDSLTQQDVSTGHESRRIDDKVGQSCDVLVTWLLLTSNWLLITFLSHIYIFVTCWHIWHIWCIFHIFTMRWVVRSSKWFWARPRPSNQFACGLPCLRRPPSTCPTRTPRRRPTAVPWAGCSCGTSWAP